MNDLLTDIRTKADARVRQLNADIADAEKILKLYREELHPLLLVLQATAPKTETPEVTETPKTVEPPVYDVAPVPYSPVASATPENLPPISLTITPPREPAGAVHIRRFSQFKLQPRYRLFLEHFRDRSVITRDDVKSWYARKINPRIAANSLNTASLLVPNVLVQKGILVPHGTESWVFAR